MTERYNEVYEEEYCESRRWVSDEVARDRAKVAACLDALARRGLLKVQRLQAGGSGWVRHRVLVLNEEGEEIAEIGGRIEVYDLWRTGESWPFDTERLADGRLRIELMIAAQFPDIEMFRRKDGSRMDLGFNDNEHYYSFSVVMDEQDLEDH